MKRNISSYHSNIYYYFVLYGSKLSQRSGILGLGHKNIEIEHENDLFGNLKSDKFRTSGLRVSYITNVFRFSVNNILWTGNASSPLSRKKFNDDFSRFGYIDIPEKEFGNISHGILSFSGSYALSSNNHASLSAGLDHEKIRNFIQNKVAHDLPIVPEKWSKSKNFHIPMLDADYKPYLYKVNQELKKGKLYLQTGINRLYFY